MQKPLRLLLLACATALGGCISLYQPEVRQGNLVTQEAIDRLQPGMSRSQVRFVLGSPSFQDPFHDNRWEYVYYHQDTGGRLTAMRRVHVLFEGDSLAKVQGDVVIEDAPKQSKGAR